MYGGRFLKVQSSVRIKPVTKPMADKLIDTMTNWIVRDCGLINILEVKGFTKVLKLSLLSNYALWLPGD